MYTSDRAGKQGGRTSFAAVYLPASAACALFGGVYELFGHGVYSRFMLFAFAFPLLLGAAPAFLLQRAGKPPRGGASEALIHAGVAALTVGSLVQGALEIYGTTNPLVLGYWVVGGVLTAAGWLSAVLPAQPAAEPSPRCGDGREEGPGRK